MKTHKFFNTATRQAMFEQVKGYVDKSIDLGARIERIKREHGIERIYRFDLGENAEGYSPRIEQYLDGFRGSDGRIAPDRLVAWLSAYPDRDHTGLKRALSLRYGIPAEWVLIDAGLDSILDLITRVFLEHGDGFLMPTPSFYLFEEYSERMGAVPYFLPLLERDQYRWTEEVISQYRKLVARFQPKLVWLANPNNPTGQFIEPELLRELIDHACDYNAFVVIDEAYGEYTDPPGDVHSAARWLTRYENLLVLRTFSKKYGLASLRIGYAMCASPDIREGLQVHRHHFPVTQAALDLASIALEDRAFLEHSRARTLANRAEMFQRIGGLQSFALIPSQTNIFMLRNRQLDGAQFAAALERFGIIASPLEISGIKERGFLRFTLRSVEDNLHLCAALEEIDYGLA